MDPILIIYPILLVILLILSAYFSIADMVYGSVSDLRLKSYLANNNKRSVRVALRLTEKYGFTISSVTLLNNLVNIGSETLGTFLGIAIATNYGFDKGLTSTIASVVILILVIVFGEILPKSLGKSNAFKISIAISIPTFIFVIIASPISWMGNQFSKFFNNKVNKNKFEEDVTEEELHYMVNTIQKEGVINKEKAEILKSTLDYSSTEAYKIMTPRIDLYAIDIDDDFDDIIKSESLYNHSRIPVYKDSIDNIIGFVRTKDLVRLKLEKKSNNIESILSQPLRFPRSTEINDILQDFKKTKIHCAIIVDEYGGVDGFITMEDILEEIVGEIWDEVDDVDKPFSKVKGGKYIVSGSMNLDDFCQLTNIRRDDIDTEYVTIGGYCIELLDDHFAKIDDIIDFKTIRMKVISIDDNGVVEKLLVWKKRRRKA